MDTLLDYFNNRLYVCYGLACGAHEGFLLLSYGVARSTYGWLLEAVNSVGLQYRKHSEGVVASIW